MRASFKNFVGHRIIGIARLGFATAALLFLLIALPGRVSAGDNGDADPGAEARSSRGLSAAVEKLHLRNAFGFGNAIEASPTTPPLSTVRDDRPEDRLVFETEKTVASRGAKDGDLWRLEWDNDAFVHTDNGFTNGWSLQRHSRAHSNWNSMEPSGVSRWVSRKIRGLGDGGERVVKRGSGLSHVMMTPEDISKRRVQPDDVPFAGALGWSESWYAYDNRSLNAFQVYAGILGPFSGAEKIQVQIHDWINADQPRGWGNQLDTEPLLNFNYAHKRKLLTGGEYRRRFAGDLAVGGQAGLGNYSTFAEVSLEARFGWRLPRGFAHQADPPGRGIMLNPSEDEPGRLQVYFSVVARVVATGYTVFLDGNTFAESPHPGMAYDAVSRGTVFGAHVVSGRYSVHLFLNAYDEVPFESINPVKPISEMTWGNITFDYRF